MSERLTIVPNEAEIKARLLNQWLTLVKGPNTNQRLVVNEFEKMTGEYQKGDGRSYHNLSHISKVDQVLNKYRHLARNWTALKFAGDGHDVIYIPNSTTNEEDSAIYMRGSMTRMMMLPDTISETERIINITKDHKTTDDDIDGKLMIDSDFAIFAVPQQEYDTYAQGIWQEYVGSGKVSEDAFRKGRDRLLSGWLSQDRIFLVDEIRADLEPIARQNLQRERLRLAA